MAEEKSDYERARERLKSFEAKKQERCTDYIELRGNRSQIERLLSLYSEFPIIEEGKFFDRPYLAVRTGKPYRCIGIEQLRECTLALPEAAWDIRYFKGMGIDESNFFLCYSVEGRRYEVKMSKPRDQKS